MGVDPRDHRDGHHRGDRHRRRAPTHADHRGRDGHPWDVRYQGWVAHQGDLHPDRHQGEPPYGHPNRAAAESVYQKGTAVGAAAESVCPTANGEAQRASWRHRMQHPMPRRDLLGHRGAAGSPGADQAGGAEPRKADRRVREGRAEHPGVLADAVLEPRAERQDEAGRRHRAAEPVVADPMRHWR